MRSKVTFVFSLVVVFCLLAMPGLTAAAHNLPQWTQANPVPPNELMANINAMTEFKGELYAGTMSVISAVPVNSAVYRSKDGMNWKKVSQDGFGDPLHNTTIGAMIAFKDKLYVGTGDWFRNGVAQLWRTRDGATWEPIDTAGFGDSNNFVLSGLTTYRGMLYAASWNSEKGVQIVRSATGNPGSWAKATGIFDDAIYAAQMNTGFITYDDRLYLAVEGQGTGVYRSKDGSKWEAVSPAGLWGGTGGFAIYKDQLYLGVGTSTGGGIWRTRDGKNWSRVMEGGFGDANNWKVETLVTYAGDLYAIVSNMGTGVEVWGTNGGEKWEQVNLDGFNGSCFPDGFFPGPCNWGTLFKNTPTLFKGGLYVGTWNFMGGEIWRMEKHE
jgi:hypothetical protein